MAQDFGFTGVLGKQAHRYVGWAMFSAHLFSCNHANGYFVIGFFLHGLYQNYGF